MSTKRAKQHKERTHIGRLVREHINETNKGGLFDKQLNKHQCNPRKFRRRAYHRTKELENGSSTVFEGGATGLLQFVTAPFDPLWATKEKHNDD